MYLFDFFRSFLPLRNPIGFGISDFVVFAIALLLAALLALRAPLLPHVKRIAESPRAAMLTLTGLAILLRIALLPSAPVPIPAGADDFSYILLADTLRHLRFANPPHPLSQFFEAVFILQHPTYASIYPPGQGIALALGRMLFGNYWAGVLAGGAAFAALTYWMLRAWIAPIWAFAGGLLAVIEFGSLSPWMNSYWGGFVSACAGCLVFGSLPRRPSRSSGLLLGLGLALQLLTRPFEFLILLLCAGAYAARWMRPKHWRTLVYAAPPLVPAVLLLLLQNKSVTGSWLTMPYQLSQYQYGVPTTFTFQPNPVPHNPLTPEQESDYRAQAAIHGYHAETPSRFFLRLLDRLPYACFFLLPPLLLALIFLIRIRERQLLYLLATLSLFFLATNFYPYFFPHYIAATACLFFLLAVYALQSLQNRNALAAALILALCFTHFLFWYGIHLSNNPALLAATTYEPFDYVNHDDPEGRRAVAHQLANTPGDQLVFVRYAPQHRFREWIANAADIDRARVVWALDLGSDENQKLEHYYSSRKKWLLEPDQRPPRLMPYPEP
jgi:hypothetical protein